MREREVGRESEMENVWKQRRKRGRAGRKRVTMRDKREE